MKIAWFTPFSDGSPVAHFSGMVTRELSRHADVDIWHPPAPSLQPTALRTIAMPRRVRVSPSMLEAYDRAVYNLGEDDDGRIAEAACAAPGIAILHGAVEAPVRRAYAVVVHSEAERALATRLSPAHVAIIPIEKRSRGSNGSRMSFSPRKYAGSLLSLAETVRLVAPVLRWVDTTAGRLAEMGVEGDAAALDRVAREAYSLLGGGASSA